MTAAYRRGHYVRDRDAADGHPQPSEDCPSALPRLLAGQFHIQDVELQQRGTQLSCQQCELFTIKINVIAYPN